jgi:hypothetical protein
MSKRKSDKPRTRARSGPQTPTGKDFLPTLPPDDPIYKQGWIVGQTLSGASPKHAQKRNGGQRLFAPVHRLAQRVPNVDFFVVLAHDALRTGLRSAPRKSEGPTALAAFLTRPQVVA